MRQSTKLAMYHFKASQKPSKHLDLVMCLSSHFLDYLLCTLDTVNAAHTLTCPDAAQSRISGIHGRLVLFYNPADFA